MRTGLRYLGQGGTSKRPSHQPIRKREKSFSAAGGATYVAIVDAIRIQEVFYSRNLQAVEIFSNSVPRTIPRDYIWVLKVQVFVNGVWLRFLHKLHVGSLRLSFGTFGDEMKRFRSMKTSRFPNRGVLRCMEQRCPWGVRAASAIRPYRSSIFRVHIFHALHENEAYLKCSH